MKRIIKTFCIAFLIAVFCAVAIFLTVFSIPPKIELDEKLLINSSDFTSFYDRRNFEILPIDQTLNGSFDGEFSTTLKNAFIAQEDKNFYKHHGLDYPRILKAVFVNLKSLSFKQGASTISQQLVKNTHLSSEKTLSRKITEIKLTKKLEKRYSKDEILSMYLNTIYFGENCYGVNSASKHYFGKAPNELCLSECATLAGLISAPSKFNPNANINLATEKRNVVLDRMQKCGFISESEKNSAKSEKIITITDNGNACDSYLKACYNELNDLGFSPYSLKNCKIYTEYEPDLQKFLFENKITTSDCQFIVTENKSNGILAYYSSCGEIKREPASTAKPFAVYAPAIDTGAITLQTKILDEKTDFGGYSPSNFGDVYSGMVSVKTAISKSLNVPAVKTLDTIGIKVAKDYAKKLNIDIKNDSLGIALGNFSNGIALKDLSSAYTTFANFGEYKKPHFINKIINDYGNTVYAYDSSVTEVFDESTSTLITEALKDSTKSGTSKKLSGLNFEIAAKTGTYGDKNGNFDCYSIAYTTRHTFGVWLGNADNSYLPNSETGGNTPTHLVSKIAEAVYKADKPENFPLKSVVEVDIDKHAYEEENKLLLADTGAPERYVEKMLFPVGKTPTERATNYTFPEAKNVKINFEDGVVEITYDLEEHQKVRIYKIFNDNTLLAYCGKDNYHETLTDEGTYRYKVVTFCDSKNGENEGAEVLLPSIYYNKKSDKKVAPDIFDDWWLN